MRQRFDHSIAHKNNENLGDSNAHKSAFDRTSINESNFSNTALQAFSAVDRSHDGLLQKQELQEALSYNLVNGPERKAVQIMLDNFDVVDSLSGELPITSKHKDGISKADLEGFNKIRAGESSFMGNYALSNIKEATYFSSLGGTILPSLGALGLFSLKSGAAIGAAIFGPAVLGATIAAGYSYYKFKHDQAPKVESFLAELNASRELRSRL